MRFFIVSVLLKCSLKFYGQKHVGNDEYANEKGVNYGAQTRKLCLA